MNFFLRVHALESDMQSFGMMPGVGITLSTDPHWKSQVEIKYKQSIWGEELSEPVYLWHNRFSFFSNWDLRFEYEHVVKSETILVVNYYW